MDTIEIIEAVRQRFEAAMLESFNGADIRRQDAYGVAGYINTCTDWAWRGYMIGVAVESSNARNQSRAN